MLIKMIGAMLILISCGSVGFRIAASQRREETTLDKLCSLLDFMECELQYRMTPLPVLCRKTAAQADGLLRQVFLTLATELESQISPDVESCMFAALNKCNALPLKAAECLQELGKTLGRFDIEGQIKGLEASRQTCRRKLQLLRQNKDSRLRGYQTLGLCAGASIVILFI